MKNILILLLLFSTGANAQNKRGGYCSCNEAKPIIGKNYFADSLYAVSKENATSIAVNLINTSKDTLFIFSSYLQKQFLSSRYLHRVDLLNKIYKISFLPIVPYVFTKYSDAVVMNDNAIIGNHQIVYDFFKLPPNSSQHLEFSDQQLFSSKSEKNNASKDFDTKKLNKYSKKPQTFYTTSTLKGKYEFEFAVYKSVDLLCNEHAYYLQESGFDKRSKSFNVLTVPAKIKHFGHGNQ